jgi:hypothetical protein
MVAERIINVPSLSRRDMPERIKNSDLRRRVDKSSSTDSTPPRPNSRQKLKEIERDDQLRSRGLNIYH